MLKAKCIKGFSVGKCDDDGFTIDEEYETIEEGTVWYTPENEDYRLIDGEIRLERIEDDTYFWIEMSKETLEDYFEIITDDSDKEMDCLCCTLNKETACGDCCRDWDEDFDD